MFIRPCTWDKLISLFNDSGKHATLTDAGPRRERMDGKGLSPNREGKRIQRTVCVLISRGETMLSRVERDDDEETLKKRSSSEIYLFVHLHV